MILLFLVLCPRLRSNDIGSSSSPARKQLSMVRFPLEDLNNCSNSNSNRTNSNNLFLFPHHSSSKNGYSNSRYLLSFHHLHRSQFKLNVVEASFDGWFQSALTVELTARIGDIILSLVSDHRLCSCQNNSSHNPARKLLSILRFPVGGHKVCNSSNDSSRETNNSLSRSWLYLHRLHGLQLRSYPVSYTHLTLPTISSV